ncbi:hypothetical protein C2857_004087 [Epichloe festucae Fl1]|uniref:BRCT domain-containing protein n=1 Tax=Epichloe festucae (strain Fl1) TaxID=877507 RepID=A0A7S9KP10_EPIFF|nr:hypothetical protein C2857_004087 [Epichloe festucae Fl1]
MTRFNSLVQAEKAALEGSNESQDSQAILDAFKAEFGVGAISSSPPRHLFLSRVTEPRSQTEAECLQTVTVTVTDSLGPVDVAAKPAKPATQKKQATGTTANRDVSTSITIVDEPPRDGTQNASDLPETAPVDRDLYKDDATVVTSRLQHERRSATLSAENKPEPLLVVPGRRKMDGSQQTPTQVNEDRDYVTFCEPMPSSPADYTQLTSNEEPRTLNANDTGAVNFGSLSEFARPSSQVSEDGGFENTRGQWRLPTDAAASYGLTPYKPHNVPLETPVLPKNPFGMESNGTGGAVPFGGTQLFGQTQMLSSAIKLASPTSSRPSPAVFVNIVETSPLKNRTNVSSPTNIQTSSPTRQHEVPATVSKDKDPSVIAEETPVPRQSQKDDLIPESPTTSRLAVGHQPMAYYEPMKYSQERKGSDKRLQKPNPMDSDSDDETFQMLERKKRVERKRALAAKEMDKVSFVRTQRKSSPTDERPGKRRKLDFTANVDENKENRANGAAQPCVRDSQKAVSQSTEPPSLESTKATPGETAEVEIEAPEVYEPVPSAPQPESKMLDEEMIPATSPVCSSPAAYRGDVPSASEPELPTLRRSGTGQGLEDAADCSSLPPVCRQPHRTYGRRGRKSRTRLAVVSSADADADDRVDHNPEPPPLPLPLQLSDEANQDAGNSEDTVKPGPTSSNLEPPQRVSTRSTPRRSRSAHKAVTTSSSLTNLSGTPVPSSKTTPDTQSSPMSARPVSVNLISSEKSTRPLRKGATRPRHAPRSGSESPQPLTKAMRLSRRSIRIDSDSTDELHCTPSKSSRSFRTSLGQIPRSRRLFEGMVFALSFSDNQTQRTKIEAKITQAGGMILHEGFQELFESSPLLHTNTTTVKDSDDFLTLGKTNSGCGFAAVIADSHSRKAKYMQALALGLPCLAPQWASMCLKRGEIVDWMPYLLCAGQSQVLGNAIRSRTLLPYNAIEAKLFNVLKERDKLLNGQKLLIIMDPKKARKETKQQYLFLALALGPSIISRVSTVQQAGAAVRQAEQNGAPFGCVYMDSLSNSTIESVLAAAQDTGKKKRKSTVAKPVGRNLNILTDELMIQSLILGRMVEVDEME